MLCMPPGGSFEEHTREAAVETLRYLADTGIVRWQVLVENVT